MINAIFSIICIGAITAFLVMWAKYDEQKKLTQEECEKRWDEISRAATIEKEATFWKEANDDKIKDILFYHAECTKLAMERETMQDKLSSLLCPTNNHVWRDGVCVKCGMAYNG